MTTTEERETFETGLTVFQPTTPAEMTHRLAAMKSQLTLTQQFFSEVMVRDTDYGVIPGTQKPTLLKPGAEKLAEFYGYAITISDIWEQADVATGYYRARVTVALVSRGNGATVAEGVGEANTREGRYRNRWIPEWKLPAGLDVSGLQFEEKTTRNGKPYRLYNLENDDPWSLWNTVLKMAKKRGVVDAVLSATRSSGLFTQDVEDLAQWVGDAESHDASTGEIGTAGRRRTTRDDAGRSVDPPPADSDTTSEFVGLMDRSGTTWGDLAKFMKRGLSGSIEQKVGAAQAWCNEHGSSFDELIDAIVVAKAVHADQQQQETLPIE